MLEEEKLRRVIRKFMESVLLDRDTQAAMETISDSIIGIGMGEQGTVSNKEELKAVLERMNNPTAVPYKVNYPKTDIRIHGTDFATGSVVYEVVTNVDGEISKSAFIQTIAAKKENGEWKLCLVQAVPIRLTEESIVHYPLIFADSTLADLRSDLQHETFELIDKSFSGGIFGTYMTENYPLYFANETFMSQMGYNRDDFYELFSDNATKVIYKDDVERVLNEVGYYVAQNVKEYELKFRLRTRNGGFIWVIEHARRTVDANGVPVLLAITTDITEMMALQDRLKVKNDMVMSSLNYASKIQHDLLPGKLRFEMAFSDYSVLWEPRDIVGGDIYWLKTFAQGTVLCVCDCTGHGTPGALLTMLVVTTFDAMVCENNCEDPAQLLLELDTRISTVLNANIKQYFNKITDIHDGCDAIILFIANDGTVKICSSGIPIFICDGNKVQKIKGQFLHLGDGNIVNKCDIKVTEIEPNADNKFYIATDGVYDQIGGELSHPFGYGIFKDVILENHKEKQSVISEKIWQAFEKHRRGCHRRDDVEIITFKP